MNEQTILTTQSPAVEARLRSNPARLREKRAEMDRQVNPYNPLYAVLPDGSWRGERCFIIGGGPSLKGFDFERLRGKGRIIAINRAFEHIPFADILFFMDWKYFYNEIKKARLGDAVIAKWNAFGGYKAFLNMVGRRADDVHHIRSLGPTGLSRSLRGGLYHGNNSGCGALNLAFCLGCNPIYLLGFDFKYDADGTSHWHDGYRRHVAESITRGFAKRFETVEAMLKKLPGGGPRVVNLNRESGLRAFPFEDIEEALT